jgi:hypothetical protein
MSVVIQGYKTWFLTLREKGIWEQSRWEDNIQMDLREIGWGGVDWIDLVQDGKQWRALVNTVMNLRVT